VLSYGFVKHSIFSISPLQSCSFHFPLFYCILCFFSVECTALRIWISRFFKGVLSWSKRNHGCAAAQRRIRYVLMYVRYIWQSLFASVISNCVVIREGRRMTHPIAWGNSDPYVSTRDFSGWGTGRGRQAEARLHMRVLNRNFQIMIHWEKRCAPRSWVGGSTWHRRIRIINPSAKSSWLFRARYFPRYDFAVWEIRNNRRIRS